MDMTRKEFEALAALVAQRKEEARVLQDNQLDAHARRLCADLVTVCKGSNPRFDEDKFVKACGF